MVALRRRGLRVQGFKVGPDYIDPSYHTLVTSRFSRNLDTWLFPKGLLKEVFANAAKGADVAVIEGVMGLFDGIRGMSDEGSTAYVAKLLKCPVILVLDAHGSARSTAAVALGFKEFDRRLPLKGVILNKVSGPSHAEHCARVIESKVGLPVVGAIPRDDSILLTERHLGLIPAPEAKPREALLDKISELVERNVDVERIVEIARSAGPLGTVKCRLFRERKRKWRVSIGVAWDDAFNFYYRENLELMALYGAEVKFFSPMRDKSPPDVDGMYLGGGFPEMLAKELEVNEAMLASVKRAAESEMPIYGECGGLMYLTEAIVDFSGREHKMVGLFDCKAVMSRKLTLRYTLAEVVSGNVLAARGWLLTGHEFHYSKIAELPRDAKFAYLMRIGEGIDGKHDGLLEYNTLASYTHLHFAQKTRLVENFLRSCARFKRK